MTTLAVFTIAAVIGLPLLIVGAYLLVALVMLPFEVIATVREERAERTDYDHRMASRRAIAARF